MKGKIHYSSVVHTVINIPFAKDLVSMTEWQQRKGTKPQNELWKSSQLCNSFTGREKQML